MEKGKVVLMERITIKIKRLPNGQGLPLPRYMTEGAAGMDLVAAVDRDQEILPRERLLVPTGFQLALPPGYEGQVRPRSGLALKHGVTLLNSPGTIDADYRGEIKVLLVNLGEVPFTVKRGDRIAQLVIQPVTRANLEIDTELEATDRGADGFGHTGI